MKYFWSVILICALCSCLPAQQVSSPINSLPAVFYQSAQPNPAASLPVLTLTATPTTGVAPLIVTLTSVCPACVTYAWIFGDGTTAGGGASQTHVYKTAGTFYAVLGASDINGQEANATVQIIVNAVPTPSLADNRYCGPGDKPNFGSTDGPAKLPQRCINTALANTPSQGKQTLVASGGNLQQALLSASCGDTILLQAGATFTPTTLPAKNCNSGQWITLRTDAPNSSLPAEGTRLTPCYAGVTSLPARPAFPCSLPKNVLAKIQTKNGNAILVAPGANYYRLIGLEITRQAGSGIIYGLVNISGAADHLIFDRVWIHGSALDDTVRGIYLGDGTNIAVIDSYLNDFHCSVTTGACTDAQTINGGNSLLPTGPYKIVDDFLEAAAENVLFGGAPGSKVPSDIEIRRNHLFKPLSWMPGSPNFIGKSFIAKNLFEIKNAEQLLFEGNVMENSWGGFTQVGWGVLISPRGSWAATQDITIRYNTISHVGAGFTIAASQADDGTGDDSLASQRISIHDMTVDDMSASAYNGSGTAFQISSTFAKNIPLNAVTVNHVTVFTDPKHILMAIGLNPANPVRPSNIVFTNNIVVAGEFSVWSLGGQLGVCAKSGKPLVTFNKCWSSYTVTNNAIIAYPRNQGPWPTGNLFPVNDAAMKFTNFNNGNGGNYQLLSTSPYKGLGADIIALNAEIVGVQ